MMKSRSTMSHLLVAAALCATTSLSGGVEYIRLVDSNPAPPPVAPEITSRAVRLTSALEIIAAGGPLYNETKVYRELKKKFEEELRKGVEQANRLGQRGVLIQTQVYTQTTEAGPLYRLRGSGATLVGVGNDPNDVCFSTKCYSYIEEPLPAGAELTRESGYMWVEQSLDGKTYATSVYRRDLLEERARQVYLNEQLSDAYRTAITSVAIDGYASQLGKTVRTRQEREAVQNLIKSRDDAIRQLTTVEKDLAKALRRAERAAKTSATLSSIAGALSLASTLAMMNASMGEDVTSAGVFASKADAVNAIKDIEAQTGQRIKSLTLEQKTLRNNITGWEGGLLRIGVVYEMVPPVGNVLNQKR